MAEEKKLSERLDAQDELLKKMADKMGIKDESKQEEQVIKVGKFRLPWKVKSGLKKNIKQGKILVMWQYENRNSRFGWYKTEFNSFLDENKIPRMFSEKDIRFIEGKIPYIIQPINDTKPLDVDFKRQTAEDAEVGGVLIKWLEKSRLDAQQKKGFSMIWIWIALIAVAGFAIYKYTQGG